MATGLQNLNRLRAVSGFSILCMASHFIFVEQATSICGHTT
jgi:hypothetical protein